jgi:hypothetical protein
MAEYYLYLWKATWVEVLGLALLFFVVFMRIGRIRTSYRQGLGQWGKFVMILKGIGWLGIFSTYLLMFYVAEPDWFAKPHWVQGEILGKTMNQSSQYPYTLELQSEIDRINLFVDNLVYQEIKTGQRVKVSYLPHRREIVTCEILP